MYVYMYVCTCSCIMISIPQSTDDKLVKIDYITEFSQWLHTNNYSTQYVMDHLQWAVELLLVKGPNHTQYSIIYLDKLIILHVMMMEVVRGNDKRKQYCLQALAYCILIWKVNKELLLIIIIN